MAGIINFVASDFIENVDTTNTNFHVRQSSYSYSKDSFKKLYSKRFANNMDSQMRVNYASVYTATTSPIEIVIDGATTLTARLRRGHTLALEGIGGSVGTVRSTYPDGNLDGSGQLNLYSIVLNSLLQDIADDTELYFSSDEAVIYIQFDTEGDLVDRDQVYLIVEQQHATAIVEFISKEISKDGYLSISPNSTTGIGRHIIYIGVTGGESFILE